MAPARERDFFAVVVAGVTAESVVAVAAAVAVVPPPPPPPEDAFPEVFDEALEGVFDGVFEGVCDGFLGDVFGGALPGEPGGVDLALDLPPALSLPIGVAVVLKNDLAGPLGTPEGERGAIAGWSSTLAWSMMLASIGCHCGIALSLEMVCFRCFVFV